MLWEAREPAFPSITSDQPFSLLWASGFWSVESDLTRCSQKLLLWSRVYDNFTLKNPEKRCQYTFCSRLTVCVQEVSFCRRDHSLIRERENKTYYLSGPRPDVPTFLISDRMWNSLEEGFPPIKENAQRESMEHPGPSQEGPRTPLAIYWTFSSLPFLLLPCWPRIPDWHICSRWSFHSQL